MVHIFGANEWADEITKLESQAKNSMTYGDLHAPEAICVAEMVEEMNKCDI